MPEIVVAPAPEVVVEQSAPKPTRFEIPVLTELKPAVVEPPAKAPEATPPVATEPEKVAEAPKPDPEAEAASKARAERLRTNRLFKQNAELKAKYDLAQEELAKARAPAAATAALNGAPDPAKFTDIVEYTKAVTEWAKSENTKETSQKQQQEQVTRQQQELVASWDGSYERGVGKYEDFETKVGEIKPNEPWSIALMQCENSEDVAYYLGNNLPEARRIIALAPLAQIREIGKLEAKLLATPPTPKPASKAPAPINPVQGVAVPTETLSPDMDFEKFRKLRNRQLGRS